MTKYLTAQRRKLMSFLKEHPDSQFSAKEILEQLHDESISLSAVYRNLNVLEESGQIVSALRDGIRDKYYRCMLSEECQSCIHLTCMKCGKTFHMDEEETQNLIENTLNKNGFCISAGKSVLYGICKDCI